MDPETAARLLHQMGLDPGDLTEEQMDTLSTAAYTKTPKEQSELSGDKMEIIHPPVDAQALEKLVRSMNISVMTPDDILRRCHALLEEIQKFAAYCEKKKHQTEYRQKVDYTHFRSDIQHEIKQMEKIKRSNLPPERVRQLVNASNLIYWEALWSAAKQNLAVTVLRRHGSPIDIIAEGGLKWIKVSTITERRLLMEMAKQGWDWAGMSDDEMSEDEDSDVPKRPREEEVDISIVKMAVTLSKMARETRVKYKHPRVHIILTRIRPGNQDINTVLDHIRATGATVQTADQTSDAPPVEDVLEELVPDESKYFSDTLNIDCTILLAIASDISHGLIKEEPWFNRNVQRQIHIEEKERLMPNSLWPAMVGRNLVCTRFAATRMREIVDLIGTETERARAPLLMGDDPSLSHVERLHQFQQLSEHPIPESWRLPIKVIDENDSSLPALPSLAIPVAQQLTDINQSVFLFGWRCGHTTITSNRVAAKSIEKSVEENRSHDDDVGPDVWICPTARSLVAKEKDRRDGGLDGIA